MEKHPQPVRIEPPVRRELPVLRRPLFHFMGILILLTLACGLSEAGGDVMEMGATAQAVFNAGGALLNTAQALATQQGPWIATAQVMVTQKGPSVIATAQSFATQQAPLIATAYALATAQGPLFLQTAQAIATQAAVGEAPLDIPVVAMETTQNYFASRDVVSYATSLSYTSVLEFYQQTLPANGWEAERDDWRQDQNVSILKYVKPDRVAWITISYIG